MVKSDSISMNILVVPSQHVSIALFAAMPASA